MSGFAKIFTQIFDSSVAEDYRVRLVFEDLLKLADSNGIVDMTKQAISRRTNVPMDIVEHGIKQLEKADPMSRSAECEGRRIVRLDEHRDWGWRIVNHAKYRSCCNEEMVRDYEATRKAAYRRKKSDLSSTPPLFKDTEAEAEAEARKLGHSGTSPGQSGTRPGQVPDKEWLECLSKDKTYEGIDVHREYGKMRRWCEQHRKQPTRRRFINWLNNTEKPMTHESKRSSEQNPRNNNSNAARIGEYAHIGKVV